MIQIGEEVLCVKPYSSWLTKGRRYKVHDISNKCIYVFGDTGSIGGFSIAQGHLEPIPFVYSDGLENWE